MLIEWRRHFNPKRRMRALDLIDQLRQIALQVESKRKEVRHDDYARYSFRECFQRSRQIRLSALQERRHDGFQSAASRHFGSHGPNRVVGRFDAGSMCEDDVRGLHETTTAGGSAWTGK